jgi:hypothetical protein
MCFFQQKSSLFLPPVAQIFPKFASHPKSKTLRFSEPNAELLAKWGRPQQAQRIVQIVS